MLKKTLQQVRFTEGQLEQLKLNETRLRNAIRGCLLALLRFVSSGTNETRCVQALAIGSRRIRGLIYSCEQTIAAAKEQRPDVIIVRIGTADADDTSNAYGNCGGQDSNLNNLFNGAERRNQCAEWDADIAGAMECVKRIEDILFVPLECYVPQDLLAALASFLRALELQRRYLLQTKGHHKTEIRVEFEGGRQLDHVGAELQS